jgi:hypothetical protein
LTNISTERADIMGASMSTESSFYMQQVANCAREAEAAALPNQRDKYLRAQSAWQALADRKLLTEAKRARIEAEREREITADADRTSSGPPRCPAAAGQNS